MIKKFLTSSIVFFWMFTAVASPIYAGDWATMSTGNRVCVKSYEGEVADVATIQGLECLLANVLASAVTLIGIVAFVMFLIGSFRYLTAGANTKGIEAGKGAITHAIIGIVVALSAFVILQFIMNFTGVTTIMNFNTQVNQQTP